MARWRAKILAEITVRCAAVAQRFEKWNTSRWRGARTKKSGARPARLYSTIRQMTVASTPAVTQAQFFFIQDSEYFFGQCIGHSRAINFPLCAMCMTVDRRTQCTVERRTQCTVDRRTQCTVDRRTQSTAELGTRQFFSFATT